MKSHVEIIKREKAYWEVRDDVSYLTTEAIDDIVSRLPPVRLAPSWQAWFLLVAQK